MTSPRYRGNAFIHLMVSLPLMIGFCSLAVDFARCQLAKNEIEIATEAAARAAAENLPNGQSAAINAAVAAAAANTANGQSVTLNTSTDIQFLNWTGPGNYTVLSSGNFAQANAVRVYGHLTAAKGNAVTLVFAYFIGQSSCDINTSVIALLNTQTTTQYVACIDNPWLSGEPTGTTASVTDAAYQGPKVNSEHPWALDIAGPPGSKAASGQPYNSPVQMPITISPGSTIQLINVTGQGTNDPTLAMYDADGFSNGTTSPAYDWAATGTVPSEHGMSQLNAPHNALIGVFLDGGLPDNEGTAPLGLDFTTQTARDYGTLQPALRQPFYIGNGQTSGGAQQSIIIPAGATRLFMGTMDGHEWSNNVGGFTATVRQRYVSVVG